MHGILSNGLSLLAEAQPQSAGDDSSGLLSPHMMAILIVGGTLGIYWLVQTIRSPRAFLLTDSPPRPNQIHPILPMGVFLLVMVMTGVAREMITGRVDADRAFILTVLFNNTTMLVVSLLVAAKLFVGGLRGAGLSLRFWTVDITRGAAGWLISLPICLGLLVLVIVLIETFAPDQADEWIRQHGMLEARAAVSPLWRVLICVSAAVLAPLSEEVLFRGLVQSSIRQFTQRPWLAVIVTSVLFAIAHGEWHTWPALIALSVVMGYSYERTGRLTPAIVTHALFNATNLWLI